jgi:DNA helicase HerA-like ATPase
VIDSRSNNGPAATVAPPIGHVVGVAGSRVTAAIETERITNEALRVGSLVKVVNGSCEIVASISEVRDGSESAAGRLLIADLLGELVSVGAQIEFSRGVSVHPVPGEAVVTLSEDDLRAIYGEPSQASIRIGTLCQDPERPAFVFTDELLGKHFAILGTTGSGKSCALALILSAILKKHSNAHVVLLDPHNEYAGAFGALADVISVDNLQLPLWLLNFEEVSRVLVRGGSETEQGSQSLILKDAITAARRNYERCDPRGQAITVDTPVPFRVYELLRFINEQMGRLAKPDTSMPYLRLRARIESLRSDRRFEFLFSSEEDNLAEIVGRLLRVPVSGKPLTIVDLSGVPSEIADVIVSTLCRVLFDFSVWCEHERMPPLLLACEEAQRYVPADERLGFAQTIRIITQIAKEGRKYGISLGLITQRPSELSLAALSQCGTVFAMRMGSEGDQQFIARALPDVARDMLSALPSLPTQQAIVSGDGVRVPTRIRFDDLDKDRRPHSDGATFSEAWQTDAANRDFIERGIRRWRAQIRN